jgi:epoxyqueuosine reductase
VLPPCRLPPVTLILISDLTEQLKAKATAEGFSDMRITQAKLAPAIGEDLQAYVEQGHHGSMAWIAETIARRTSPDAMWENAKSAIVLALNYDQGLDAFARLTQKSTGVISTYAMHRDYHDLIKGKLKRIASWLAQVAKVEVKVFVDTAPLMEKPLAAQAGLGWQGKHTNLVSRQLGSWFFIGTILTSAELKFDEAEVNHCGTCQACMDVCPTNAIKTAHQIDARACISYLTIEHKGPIPQQFRKAIGNRIYGCDDCLAICPWNKFAREASEIKLKARDDLIAPQLADLLQLNDAGFRQKFAGSPIKRIGRISFVRNVVIAAGNSGDVALIPHLQTLLQENDETLREAATWSLGELQ